MAMFIMTLMVAAILAVYTKGQQTFINENVLADTVEGARYPLAWITRDVRMAVAIEASWSGYTTSANTLVLKIPSVDANGLIIDLKAHWDRIIYCLTTNKFYRIVDAESGVSARLDDTRLLADKTSALAFSYYDSSGTLLTSNFATASAVQATLTSRRPGDRRTFTVSFDTKAKLRNK